jgi:hypothetical protein
MAPERSCVLVDVMRLTVVVVAPLDVVSASVPAQSSWRVRQNEMLQSALLGFSCS